MPDSKPSIILLGTPTFAIPTLRALASSVEYSISAIITQPDKPAGRGRKMQPPAVKETALELGIPVFQPESIKNILLNSSGGITANTSDKNLNSYFAKLKQLDACVVVAYGKLIPKALLQFPRCGAINIHPSLLPRWRGAAPIQHAIFSGDRETGVSLMALDEGLDTGAVYAQLKTPIKANETFGELHDRLAIDSADFLATTLPAILDGTLQSASQPETGVTYAEKWDAEDFVISWEQSSEITLRRILTCAPQPGARTWFGNQLVKIYRAHRTADENFPKETPGTIVEATKKDIIVAAGSSEFVSIDELQFPGKKRLPAAEVLRGKSIKAGMKFETSLSEGSQS